MILTWDDWINEGASMTVSSGEWPLKDIDLTACSGERIRLAIFHSETGLPEFEIEGIIWQSTRPAT